MRRRIAVLFLVLALALAGVVQPAAATGVDGDVDVYTGSIAGAQYRVEVPADWNGTLLLFSHGLYPESHVPEEIELATTVVDRW